MYQDYVYFIIISCHILLHQEGRTPLHYAAALDDNQFMYSLLRAAYAKDDEQDMVNTLKYYAHAYISQIFDV